MPSVRKNSRYSSTPIYQLRSGVGAVSNTFVYGVWQRPIDFTNYNFKTYHVVTRDEVGRLDLISYRYYGDPTMWWAIADANQINNYLDEMEAGQELAIPEFEDLSQALTGPGGNTPRNNYTGQ